MRSWSLLLTLLTALPPLAGCGPESAPVEIRPVRTIVVDPKPIDDHRQARAWIQPL